MSYQIQLDARPRRLALAAAAGMCLVQAIAAAPAAAHGICNPIAQTPFRSGTKVVGMFTYDCSPNQHDRTTGYVRVEYRDLLGTTWAGVDSNYGEVRNSQSITVWADNADCHTGWWRTYGKGEAYNNAGQLVHTGAHYSVETLIIC